MRSKRWIAAFVAAALCLSLCACGGKKESGKKDTGKESASKEETTEDFSGVELEVACKYTGDALTTFQEICDEFQEKTGCTIVLDNYGADYSNMMTNRTAANDLPDVFETAGWSLQRFKDYSLELTDQPYVAHYDDTAKNVIQDTDGKYYACMISDGMNCMVVNLTVCEKAGVDPASIHTWDDFLAACGKIKDAGFTPIGSKPNAGLTCNIAGTFLTYKGEAADVGAKMKDGTWDWAEYNLIIDFWKKALTSGYCFKDAKSMSEDNKFERFASGQSAFLVSENFDAIQESLKINPDGSYIMAPFPASKAGGEETVAMGEGDSYAVWKDSQAIDCAKSFLKYLATPEVTLKLISETGRIACIDTTTTKDDGPGLQALNELKERYKDHDVKFYNVFDRDYLPSGMWGQMGNAANKIFSNYSNDEKLAQIIPDLKKSYDQYYKSEHSE